MANRGINKGKMGRPTIPLDWDKVDLLCSYKLSLDDIAYLSNISSRQLEERIRQKDDCTFLVYRAKKLGDTKVKLIKKALEKAEMGDNTMLIFCLKNLCKWNDNNNPGFISLD